MPVLHLTSPSSKPFQKKRSFILLAFPHFPHSGSNSTLSRLLALFNILYFALINPLVTPVRTMSRAVWENFLSRMPMPNMERNRILNWIYPGPSLDFITEVPSIDPKDQRCFENEKAVSVLKEFLDHYLMGKFLGPFPPWVKTLNNIPIRLISTFTLKKQDSTTAR